MLNKCWVSFCTLHTFLTSTRKFTQTTDKSLLMWIQSYTAMKLHQHSTYCVLMWLCLCPLAICRGWWSVLPFMRLTTSPQEPGRSTYKTGVLTWRHATTNVDHVTVIWWSRQSCPKPGESLSTLRQFQETLANINVRVCFSQSLVITFAKYTWFLVTNKAMHMI